MITQNNLNELESRLQQLLQQDISSVAELQAWLAAEKVLRDEFTEMLTLHRIAFYGDTAHAEKRAVYLHDETDVQPLLTKYYAELDRKCCECPFTEHLDDANYGLMRKVRQTKVQLFREENIPLMVREKELVAQYSETMGRLLVEWEGELKPYPFVQAQAEGADRSVRERAWRALAEARNRLKPQVDAIMDELVQVRHQMAQNAGFANYRDYMMQVMNREYTVQDLADFHASVEQHVVPVVASIAELYQTEKGIDTYRPWDLGPCALQGLPFVTVNELIEGVEQMLGEIDPYFQERFQYMRENELLDLESRAGKLQGAFCDPLPASQEAFVFSNFSPSFVAINALVHEMGHAINEYLQFATGTVRKEYANREEICELFSHGLELLVLDKLDHFYPEQQELHHAQRQLLQRTLDMMINPIVGDLFQHWLYTNPQHTASERDAYFLEINKRFTYHSVDITGCEAEIATSWFRKAHYFAHPFYSIEYAMAQVGALQLLHIYRQDPKRAIALYKQGAGTDYNQSIADVYRDTGVEFDFSAHNLAKIAFFVEGLIRELK